VPLFSAVTFNASIADVRVFGRTLYCPVPWPEERLRQLPRALFDLDADLVCLQGLQGAGRRAWLHRTLQMNYPYVAGLASRLPALRPGSTFLVLSRFPLSGARLHRFSPGGERFSGCGFLEVEVRIPAIGTFTLINFRSAAGHGPPPEGRAVERDREQQIEEILECAGSRSRVLLAGDLDAGPGQAPASYRRFLDAGYRDVYGTDRPGATWDPANPLVAGGRGAHLPPARIDHIFLSTALAARLGESRAEVVLTERRVDSPHGRVPLSDHYGIRARFRARAERGV
jgi:hypothetical protein